MSTLVMAVTAAGALALIFAWMKARQVARADVGTERMAEIAGFIQEGAMAFLGQEYRVLAIFVVVPPSTPCTPPRTPHVRRPLSVLWSPACSSCTPSWTAIMPVSHKHD